MAAFRARNTDAMDASVAHLTEGLLAFLFNAYDENTVAGDSRIEPQGQRGNQF